MPFGITLPPVGGLAPIVNLITPPAQQTPSQPSTPAQTQPTQSQPATPPAATPEPAPAAPTVVSPILPQATPPQASQPTANQPAAQQPAAQPPAAQPTPQAASPAAASQPAATPAPSKALVPSQERPTETKKVVSIDEAREAALANMEKERLTSMIRSIAEGGSNSVVELVKSTRGRDQDTAGVKAAYAEADSYGKSDAPEQRRVGSI